MAQVTLDLGGATPTGRVLDAVAWKFNYNASVDGTKAAFAKAQLSRWLKSIVKEYEAFTAAAVATSGVDANVESTIVIS